MQPSAHPRLQLSQLLVKNTLDDRILHEKLLAFFFIRVSAILVRM